ncbi:acetyl-CoA carboxylase biotin carboxyl carrier protein [Rubritepida flocculans]|uniref:acetyl-CoA carboxylase biotin carboxyl carrier protein n=1 Tax=Rubritepida flocculans TaxID=182403 RepID=UPI0003F93E63|nr:acetyl-CoA carboxylase biotin carboxyl carrier protein [Rubritepida flocculans]
MTSAIQFDPEAIRRLAEILRETDLTEIELSEKDAKIRVARVIPPPPPAPVAPSYYAAPVMPAPMPPPAMAPAMVAAPAAAPAAPPAPPPASAEAVDPNHPGLVTSPMVGVAYLSPEPGAPPFVTVGSRVAAGQTLLLIEAMKTFNQIKAAKAGTVTRIFVESGMPVEYGEPLVIVE